MTLFSSGVTYPLEDTDFPTVDPKDPYTLTPSMVMHLCS